MDFCWSDINLLRKTTEINSLIQAVVAALGGRRRSGSVYLPYRATLWAVQSAASEACINYPSLELFRFHICFFGWFSALFVPVYLLTSTARYDIPGRQASCRVSRRQILLREGREKTCIDEDLKARKEEGRGANIQDSAKAVSPLMTP